jgi:hypothetical protein
MVDPDVAGVCLRAGMEGLFVDHKGVHENDERRTTLDRFIRKRRDAGVTDAELLVVEGLKYLKRLDQSEGGSAE